MVLRKPWPWHLLCLGLIILQRLLLFTPSAQAIKALGHGQSVVFCSQSGILNLVTRQEVDTQYRVYKLQEAFFVAQKEQQPSGGRRDGEFENSFGMIGMSRSCNRSIFVLKGDSLPLMVGHSLSISCLWPYWSRRLKLINIQIDSKLSKSEHLIWFPRIS